MRITRLLLRDLKVHRDLDLELAPGLTVVRGPNEAGKSTLQRALELALFRKVTAGGAEIDGLRSWGADADGRPWVSLDFVQEDPDGTRLGTLEKDFRGAKGTARLVLDGEAVTDPVFARALPSAAVPFIRFDSVPSRPAIGSDASNGPRSRASW